MQFNFQFDPLVFKPIQTSVHGPWAFWELKNFNMHRGVIHWDVEPSYKSMADIGQRVQDLALAEFRPNRIRGLGIGTVLELTVIPPDLDKIKTLISPTGFSYPVWQWAILCFPKYKRMVSIHNWYEKGLMFHVYQGLRHEVAINCTQSDSIAMEQTRQVRWLSFMNKLGTTRDIFRHFLGG